MSDKKTKAAGEKPAAQSPEERIAALEAENKALRGATSELTEQLKVKEATQGSKLPTVKVAGDNYIFTGPRARVGKKVVEAEDAAKDKELCEALVKKGSGWLKLVNIK